MFIFHIGVVTKVFEDDKLVEEAIKLGKEISQFSLPALISCKESILKGNNFYALLSHVIQQ